MGKYNIFQGNELIKKTVAKSLGYELPQEMTWFTRDIYFESYFYLSKRFGPPAILDDYKDGGTWDFTVKEYTIRLSLNSSWLEVIIFGNSHKNSLSKKNFKNYSMRSPYWIKVWRESKKKKNLLIELMSKKKTKVEQKLIDKVFKEFCIENNIDDTWTQKRFDDEKAMDWYNYTQEYNHKVLGVNHQDIVDKYGDIYKNSMTKHALRTLEQFLKNMLVPIWVRDVSFNIKGHCEDHSLSRYENNIKIQYRVKKSP